MYTDSTLSLAILIVVLLAGLVLAAVGNAARRALMRTPRASAADLRQSNGVIHVIDTVLMP